MQKPFPERPKGMHHDTEWEHLDGMRERLDTLQKQMG